MNEYPIRSVRTRDWKYIRNLSPESEHHTHVDKAEREAAEGYWPSWVRKAGEDAAAAALLGKYHKRPAEELYDLKTDPYEQRNLAGDPKYAEQLAGLRADLKEWMRQNGDEGLATEDARRPKPAAKPGARPAR
jgi:uncharacterized sulfatase